jgi:hypothetical protein
MRVGNLDLIPLESRSQFQAEFVVSNQCLHLSLVKKGLSMLTH